MTAQKEFTLTPRRRGFHLVTEEIIRNLPPLPSAGILHLFIKHTSAGLTINENADPDVQTDMEAIFNRLVKEREPYYQHTCEGDDDMPAHAKATLSGTSLTIPITNGHLNIGIWQGIYLCEFPNRVEVYDNAKHGIGIGVGTDAEGWVERAAEFWQSVSE